MEPKLIIGVVVLVLVLIIGILVYNKSTTCKDKECTNLVTLGEWKLNSETETEIKLARECTNKGSTDGCKQISKDTLNTTLNWATIECNKACGADGVGKKNITFNNKKYTSINNYPCNREDCDSLVTFSNWTLTNQDTNNATFTRTCTNKDPNRDACSLIPSTDISQTVAWGSPTAPCNKVCDTGTLTKSVNFSGQNYTSNPINCNNEPCSTIVNLGSWSIGSQDANNVTFTRTCTNNISTRNVCGLLSTNETLPWGSPTACSKACDSGTLTKSVNFNGQNYTSNPINCNTETCSSMVNLSSWSITNQNADNVTFSRTCTNNIPTRNACGLIPATDVSQTVAWANTGACSKPCDTGTLTKSVSFMGQNYTSNPINCNTETCTSMVNLSSWSITNQDSNNVTFTRTCSNKDSTRNACSLIPTNQTVTWANTGACNKACDTGTLTKSVNFNGQNYTSNPINCNTETCSSMVNLSSWSITNQNADNVTFTRTCSNRDSTRNACGLISTNETVAWGSATACSKPCDTGTLTKSVSFMGQNYTSNPINCNTETCSSMVNLSSWSITNQDSNNVTFSRTCSNRDSTRDACSLIPTNQTVTWANTGACNKACDGGTLTKSVNFNGQNYTSNPINCNTETCTSLVNLSSWSITNQNADNVTFTRTCSNRDSTRNACGLISTNETVAWGSPTACSKACDRGTLTKSVNFSGQNYTSNPINCNIETCSSMVNLSSWSITNQDANNVTFNRTCTNNIPTRNACGLIPMTDVSQTVAWGPATICNKVCDTGTLTKSVSFMGQNYTSNQINCNIEPCTSLVNLSSWSINSQDANNVTFTRTCSNNNPTRDACSLIPTNQTVTWGPSTACSKACDTGTLTKSVSFMGQNYNSNTINCNIESCSSMVNFGNWTNNSNNTSIVRTCSNKDSNRNACSLIPSTEFSINIVNIYPPQSIPERSTTISFNFITYTFTNDGCNGSNAAWTFDKNNTTVTWFDGKGRYNTATGLYDGTAASTNNVLGAWQQMQLSIPVLINGYYILSTSAFSEWYLFGSNNGNDWVQLDYRNTDLPNGQGINFIFNNTIAYSYYRFVISKSLKSGNIYNYNPNLAEFYLFYGNSRITLSDWRLTNQNNNMIVNRTCTNVDQNINDCSLLPQSILSIPVNNVSNMYINKRLILQDSRSLRYFQTGRENERNVLDVFVNINNVPGLTPDGLVNVLLAPNNNVYLKINEFLTIKNDVAGKTSNLDNLCEWRIYRDSSNRIYLNNVNYRDGTYFLYSNGDGSASLDTFLSQNVINNGGFILRSIFDLFTCYNTDCTQLSDAYISFNNTVNDIHNMLRPPIIDGSTSNGVYENDALTLNNDPNAGKIIGAYYDFIDSYNFNNGFTASIWVKFNSFTKDNNDPQADIPILTFNNGTNKVVQFGLNKDLQFAAFHFNNNIYDLIYPPNVNRETGKWYHFCITINNNTLSYYINNVKYFIQIRQPGIIANRLYIARSMWDGTKRNLIGSIKKLRLFRKNLSDSEVGLLYNTQI